MRQRIINVLYLLFGPLAAWLFHNVPLGRLAPWVFGVAIGMVPHSMKDIRKEVERDREKMQGHGESVRD